MTFSFRTIRGPINIFIPDSEIDKIKEHNLVIYSCNTNNYSPTSHFEKTIETCNKNNFGFYFFSDTPLKGLNIDNQIMFSFDAPNPRYAAKVFKILPHIFLKAKASLWIDSNIGIENNIARFFEEFNLSKKLISLFVHDKRKNIIEESEECIKNLKDDPDTIINQIKSYESQKFNITELGLYQGRILLRRHNKTVNEIMDKWWSHLSKGSIRDQLSLPVALEGFNENILYYNANELHEYFKIHYHKKYLMYSKKKSFNVFYNYIKMNFVNRFFKKNK